MKAARKTDWNTKPLPNERTTFVLGRSFSPEEMAMIRGGVIPEEMEEKWFIYFDPDSNQLYFHRSWTGNCIYVLNFEIAGETARVGRVEVNRDPTEYSETSDEYDARVLSCLIDVLLLGRRTAFPRP